MKLKLPKKKLFQDALKNNKWPVNWFDQKKEKEKEKERKRQEKISKLYPKKRTNDTQNY